jgi:chromosome segregation ATPase
MDVKKGLCHWCQREAEDDRPFCSIECFHELHHAEQLINSLRSTLADLKRQLETLNQCLGTFSEFVKQEAKSTNPRAVSIRNSNKLIEDRDNLAKRINELEEDLRCVQDRLP